MDLSKLKDFLDLGGVFILAVILLQQWSVRFNRIEDKLSRIIVLLFLALGKKISDKKVEDILKEDELKVLNGK
jgi:hypothetical protein